MATWHQQRRPVCVQHPTAWVVYYNPPNEFAYSIAFATKAEAEAHIAHRSVPHQYLIAPKA